MAFYERDACVNLKAYVLETQQKEQSIINDCTEDTLRKINVSIENLPQKCQRLIQELAILQHTAGLADLEPISITHVHCKNVLEESTENYQILDLKLKNADLQCKVEQNKKEIAKLRCGLEQARQSLRSQTPNPDTIDEDVRAMRQKLATYEDNCERAKTKFTKLNVPEDLHPKSLEVLVSQLAALRSQELELKERADEVKFTQQVRCQLKRMRFDDKHSKV